MSNESLAGEPDDRSRIGEWPLSAAEYYAEMFQLLVPDEDTGHRDRLREEIEGAIAKGSDWV
jgi:hypothetical protein